MERENYIFIASVVRGIIHYISKRYVQGDGVRL